MNFAEELFLISCDKDTGRFYPIPDKLFDLVTGGALLFDLSFRNLINDDWEKLRLLTNDNRDDLIINETISCLSIIEGEIPLEHALTLVTSRGEAFRGMIIDQLIGKGKLTYETHSKFLKSREPVFIHSEPEKISALIALIRGSVLSDIIPEPETAALISLLKAGGIHKYLFTSSELDLHMERINFLASMESLGRALSTEIEKLRMVDIDKRSEGILGLRHGEPKAFAGGIGSVLSSVSHVYKETGVRKGKKLLSKLNQKNGFECSGCAWPNPDGKRSGFEFCESGAKNLSSEATGKMVNPDFFKKYSVDALKQNSEFWFEQQGRLSHPMVLKEGATHYETISWDAAYKMIAEELKNTSDPDEAVFYVSGRACNEASFLIQLLARMYGTNNLPNSANLCHDPSGMGLKKSVGFGKGSVRLDDFPKAEAIFVFGHNPGSNHPRMLKSLQVAARKGCKIVAVNPMVEPSLLGFSNPQEVRGYLGKATPLAALYLQPRINGDMALIKGMMKFIIEAQDENHKILDKEFINKYTEGFTELRDHLLNLNWDDLVESSGLTLKEIESAAKIYMDSERTIACWCLGITQHQNSVATIQDIANLLLLKGNIGKPGAGVCPVRGHSNVQGNRTLGVGENMPEAFLKILEQKFKINIPRTKGLDAVSTLKAMYEKKVRVFISLGGNLAAAAPDTNFTTKAMSNCELTVMISTKLNSNHLVTGKTALILPCLTRSEIDIQNGKKQALMIESSMAKVGFSYGCVAPCSDQLKSETRIIADLAMAVLENNPTIDWNKLGSDYQEIRKLFTAIIPDYKGYSEEKCKKQGFYLANPIHKRVFNTDTGKAKFSVQKLETATKSDQELMLMSVRSHDQFNTSIFDLSDRYRGIKNERRIALMNLEDMKERDIKPEQMVDITSRVRGKDHSVFRYFAIPYDIKKGSVAAYFPEVNLLFPVDYHGDQYPTPAYKSLPVSITKSF